MILARVLVLSIGLGTICSAGQKVWAQSNDDRVVGDITLSDLRSSALLFVNSTASPGVDGSQLHLNEKNRQSQITRSSLGYGGDITVRDSIWDLYWGAALAFGHIDDTLQLQENGEAVQLQATRQVLSLRGSLGGSLVVTDELLVRPYVSLYLSELTSNSELGDGTTVVSARSAELGAFHSSEAYSITTAGSLEVDWQRWLDTYQWRLTGQYNLAYTDFYSEKSPHLDTWGWNAIAIARARFSGATNWRSFNRSWRWFAYSNYTNYVDQPKIAMGFTHVLETGLGMELVINLKPLDWFGFRALGMRAGYLNGDGVTGFNLGFVMR